VNAKLPAGPRMPSVLQTVGFWTRPLPFLERNRARYGKRYTVRLFRQPPFVTLSDPEDIKQVLTAPPEVLHPGEGARILEPLLGPNSVILLDEDPHLEQRRLMLPSFHGERMQNLAGLMDELTDRELHTWPTGEPFPLHPHLQTLTLEIVLRAVFGLERGSRLNDLREILTSVLRFTESPLSLLPPPGPRMERLLSRRGSFARLREVTEQADELIYALVDERRRERHQGAPEAADVLAVLLSAQHLDGSPMSDQEIRDELMTALVAGHETTASQLAWTFVLLSRAPAALERLTAEVDAGDEDSYLMATIHEAMRHRPVLPNAEPRLVKRPVDIGGVSYPPGVVLIVNAHLVHHDPAIYPNPHLFQPERFLESPPGTYTWLPFGGGRRRCLGASFAMLEMKIVLRAVLRRFAIAPANPAPETARRRSITISPSRGAEMVLSERSPAPARADGGDPAREPAPEPVPA